jgi:hypothetical protein
MKSIKLMLFLSVIFSLLFTSCRESDKDSALDFKGKVVYVDLEGGFYGIELDSGDKIDPIDDLPGEFKINNLRVMGKYKRSKDAGSIHMWGYLVNILEISAENQSGNG